MTEPTIDPERVAKRSQKRRDAEGAVKAAEAARETLLQQMTAADRAVQMAHAELNRQLELERKTLDGIEVTDDAEAKAREIIAGLTEEERAALRETL